MSTPPPSEKKSRPPFTRKPSGDHEIVREMRAKFESINDHTAPMVDALDERVERLREAVTTPPPTVGPEAEDDVDTEPEKFRPHQEHCPRAIFTVSPGKDFVCICDPPCEDCNSDRDCPIHGPKEKTP